MSVSTDIARIRQSVDATIDAASVDAYGALHRSNDVGTAVPTDTTTVLQSAFVKCDLTGCQTESDNVIETERKVLEETALAVE